MSTVISSEQANSFSRSVLSWYDEVGRKDLPWQQNKTAYRVWLSEIMLQQTQVKTVIPYYLKFLAEFPTVEELAAAPIDHVLHLWSGLGYYARARNLHRCAELVCSQHQGEFPIGVEALSELPGIGRSTAGAIASIAQGQHAAILDGNVKRVLCRVFAVEGHPSIRATEKLLWSLAEATTPKTRCNDYTQAIMDLGATTCSRSKPDCDTCPVKDHCLARQQLRQTDYPNKKVKKQSPTRETYPVLFQRQDGAIWLEKRPSTGIWGGLHCFPEISHPDELESLPFGSSAKLNATELASIEHIFSHFKLLMKPLLVSIHEPQQVAESSGVWYDPAFPAQVGIARPVERILSTLLAEAPISK
ncbi:A/G-specific adenine glycosylase [uncultured Umboniibacter sp.]|uniref:A/G-specific adenine glycosylase n=1 Tax=uncultured Umboniibacter sp. TaxID=1798917 RepID=UPI0034473CE6